MGNRARREALWRENPHCYWCGVMTVQPPRSPESWFRPPNNMATLDHLYIRTDVRRQENKGPHPVVLSCYSCNQKWGEIDIQIVNSETLQSFRNQAFNITLAEKLSTILPTQGGDNDHWRNPRSLSTSSG